MKFNYVPRQNTKHILVLDGQELSAGAIELPDNYEDYGIFVSMIASRELTQVEDPKVTTEITTDVAKTKTTRKKAAVTDAE